MTKILTLTEILADLKSAEIISDKKQIKERLLTLSKDRDGLPEEGIDKISKIKDLLIVSSTLPSVPTLDEMKSRAATVGLVWQDGMEKRFVRYIASDERVDGMGDIVRQNWDFEVFKYNSAMPLGHQWWSPPIGKYFDWKTITVTDNAGYSGPALYLAGLVAPSGVSPRIDEIANLIFLGFMTSCSVGFQALEIIVINDEEERKRLGLGRYGVIFNKNLLLENSPVTIPANEGAHKLSSLDPVAINVDSFDILTDMYRMNIKRGKDDSKTWEDIENNFIGAAKKLWGDVNYTHKELDEPLFSNKKESSIISLSSSTFTFPNSLGVTEEQVKAIVRGIIEESNKNIIDSTTNLNTKISELLTKVKDIEELLLDREINASQNPGVTPDPDEALKIWGAGLDALLSRGLPNLR